ncbi:MAG: YceI family protein, partial [Planctomycetes bacterium]|nr:YceI family protein [Planctomycetota bacterium]
MKSLFALPVLLALFTVRTEDAVQPLGEHDWAVDPVHSAAMFKVMHANASNFYGGFDAIEGTVTLDPAAPASGKVKLVIPVDSIHTRDGKRDDHLKGPDFFNSKENPHIAFASTKIAAKGEGVYEVTGDLEIAGETQSVTMMVKKV